MEFRGALSGNSVRILNLVFFICALAPMAVFAADGEHHASVSGLLWRVFVFAVFFVIMVKLLKNRIKNGLGAGVEKVAQSIADAEKACEDSEKELAEYSRKIAGMNSELENMKQTARKTIEKDAEQMVADAEKTAEKVKEIAERNINIEIIKAKSDLHNEIALAAILSAEKQLLEDTDKAKKQKYIADHIPNIGVN